MKKSNFLLAFLLLVLLSSVGFAQEASISGIVTDGSYPLPGATVSIEGTGNGAVTDLDGKFIINNVNAGNAVVKVSYIGYTSKTVNVSLAPNENKNIGTIIITEDATQLEGVVVTALGIKREEKSLGYSVSEVKGDDLNEAKETNIVNSLNGKVAGVQITNGSTGVGSTSRIVIRGEASLNSGKNQPLFVVDGIPIDNNTTLSTTENSGGSEMQEVDFGNGAADINPDDIESISVLKGATAAALYGSRGANGVVLITTKSGKGKDKISVAVNAGLTFDNVLRLPKYQNKYGQGWAGSFQYVDGLNKLAGVNYGVNDQEDVSWGPIANGQLIQQFDSPAGNGLRAGDIYARGWIRNADGTISAPSVIPNDITATPFVNRPNNVKDFFRTGITNTLSASIGVNNEKSNLLFSFNRLQNEGIIPNTDLNRNSFRLNSGFDLSKKLKLSANMNYINSASDNRPAGGYGSETAMYMFTWYGRQVNTKALQEYWQRGYEGLEQFNYNYAWHDNPYFMLNENTNAFQKNRVLGNIKLNYQFNENLSAEVKTGLDTYNDYRQSKRAFSTQRFLKGAYREGNVFFREMNTDFLIRYNKELNDKIAIGVNAGGNQMKQRRDFSSLTANRLNIPNLYNLTNSALPLVSEQFDAEKEINSLYGMANISYDDVVFLDITGRNDWSSTLPKANNSYFYPSASLSAIISDMVSLPSAFNFVKLRGSIAQVGNDTDPYNLETSYVFNTPYKGTRTLTRSKIILNENLKPEKVNSYEIGADLRMLDGLFNVDFTYYNATSQDQIITVPVSNTAGYIAQVINAGKIRNTGIEALLTVTPIEKDNFTWSSSLNFAKNVGKVIELPEDTKVLTTSYASVYDAETSKVFVQAREGERLGNMYGRKFKRHNGEIVYNRVEGKDDDGNPTVTYLPVVDDELQLLGNYNPDFSLGFQNEFKFNQFTASFLIDWKKGGTLISRTKQIATYAGNLEGSENRNDYNNIIPNGVEKQSDGSYTQVTTAIPWWDYMKPLWDRRNQQETGIVDASYAKIREVKIGYTLPNSISDRLKVKGIKASLVGRNLALFTPKDNPHFDPETLALQGNNIVPGIEDVSYPSSRSIGVNVSVQF